MAEPQRDMSAWQHINVDSTQDPRYLEAMKQTWLDARIEADPMARYERDLGPVGQAALGFDKFVGQAFRGAGTWLGDLAGADDWAESRREIDQAGARAWERTSYARPLSTQLGQVAGGASQIGLPGGFKTQAGYAAFQQAMEKAALSDNQMEIILAGAEGAAWAGGLGYGAEFAGRLGQGFLEGNAWAQQVRRGITGQPNVSQAAPGGGAIDDLVSDAMPPGGGGGGGGRDGGPTNPAAGGGRYRETYSTDRWQDDAEGLGFTLGRADRSQDPVMLMQERGFSRDPAVADILHDRYELNDQVLGRHAAQGIGVEPDALGRLTVPMRNQALNQIDDTYSRVRGVIETNGGLDIDGMVIDDMVNDLGNSAVGQEALEKIVLRFNLNSGAKLSGKDYSSLRSRIRKDAKSLNAAGDSDAAQELYNLNNYVDQAATELMGDIPGGLADASRLADDFEVAKERYRNYLAIEGGGVLRPNMEINAQSLARSMTRIKGREFTLNRSANEFDRAAHVAPRLQRYNRGSDTNLNQAMQMAGTDPSMMAKFLAVRPLKRRYMNNNDPMLDYMFGNFGARDATRQAGAVGGREAAAGLMADDIDQ